MRGNIVLRRMLAYLVDIILVTFVASMLASISYLNPKLESYNKVYDEYVKLVENNVENLDAETITPEVLGEYSYKLDRNNVYGATISIVITIIYFVIFQKYNKGQTLGKKLFKIKLDENAPLSSYFVRTLILHNVFINTLKLIFVFKMSQASYIKSSNILYVAELAIQVTILVMVIMRNDKRGLHDIIANTNVRDINERVEECTTV